MESVRILIADDHAHFREGLGALLLSSPDLEVVGKAEDGNEAVSFAAELQPDVILMEPQSGRPDTAATIVSLAAAGVTCRVILLATYEDEMAGVDLSGGVVGRLMKDLPASRLIAAIRAAIRAVPRQPRSSPC